MTFFTILPILEVKSKCENLSLANIYYKSILIMRTVSFSWLQFCSQVLVFLDSNYLDDMFQKIFNLYCLTLFSDTLRNVSGGHLAMLIPKGIERFPDCNDKMVGTIDIWWIVRIFFIELIYLK